MEEAVLETMQTQRDGPSLGWRSLLLLLLGLVMPPAIAQALSYKEAVLRAVDGFNRQSSDANLYRLLSLGSQSPAVSWRGGLTLLWLGLATLGLCSISCQQSTSCCECGPPFSRETSWSYIPS